MKNETYITTLIRLQHLAWYLIGIYFAFTTALLFLKIEFAETAIRAGVGLILTIAILRLVIIAIQFRAGNLKKFESLSYGLIVMLALIVVAKLFL